MSIGSLGTPELILILVIVVLLFGVGRISKVSEEIGKSVKSFRKGISDDDDEKKENDSPDSTKDK